MDRIERWIGTVLRPREAHGHRAGIDVFEELPIKEAIAFSLERQIGDGAMQSECSVR